MNKPSQISQLVTCPSTPDQPDDGEARRFTPAGSISSAIMANAEDAAERAFARPLGAFAVSRRGAEWDERIRDGGWIGGETANSLASDCHSGRVDSHSSSSGSRKQASGCPARLVSPSPSPLGAIARSVRICRWRARRHSLDRTILRIWLEPWAYLLCWVAAVHLLCCGRARDLRELLGQLSSGTPEPKRWIIASK